MNKFEIDDFIPFMKRNADKDAKPCAKHSESGASSTYLPIKFHISSNQVFRK